MSVHIALTRRRVEFLKRNFRVYHPGLKIYIYIYISELDLTKCQGTRKIGPLNGGFVTAKFGFIYVTLT